MECLSDLTNRDVAGCIFEYMPVNDKLQHYRQSGQLNLSDRNVKSLTEDIKQSIVYKLQNLFGEDYDPFTQAMTESKAIITGSFLLSCIYDDFEAGDIDIVLHKGGPYGFTALEDFLHPYVDEKSSAEKHKGIGAYVALNDLDDLPGAPFWDDNAIYRVRDYNYKNTNFQLILLAGPRPDNSDRVVWSPFEHVINTYDFDIIRNVFQFQRDDDQKNEDHKDKIVSTLYIHRMSDIITKSTMFRHPPNAVRNSVNRMIKYRNKGIDVKITKESCTHQTLIIAWKYMGDPMYVEGRRKLHEEVNGFQQ